MFRWRFRSEVATDSEWERSRCGCRIPRAPRPAPRTALPPAWYRRYCEEFSRRGHNATQQSKTVRILGTGDGGDCRPTTLNA